MNLLKRILKYFVVVIASILMYSNYTFAQLSLELTSNPGSFSDLDLGINSASDFTVERSSNCFWTTNIASTCLDEIAGLDEGSFFINSDGKLMYGDPDNECSATELSCAQLCDIYSMDWDGVLSATANVFTNEWDIDDEVKTAYGISSTNPTETGELSKWYVHKSYVYNTSITQMDENNNHSFEAGTMSDFNMFNYHNIQESNENWLNTNTITAYSPDGNLLEEKNLLNIYSTEKFGYNNTLPYLVAQNSHSESVFFEGFEYQYSSGRCDGSVNSICFDALRMDDTQCSLNSSIAHSGSNSIEVRLATDRDVANRYTQTLTLSSYHTSYDWTATRQMLTNGISVKLWIKSSNGNFPTFTLWGDNTSSTDDAFNDIEFSVVAQTGEWKLYEAKVETDDWINPTTLSEINLGIFIETITNGSNPPIIYLDDVRMQPLDAQMACYVYDPATFKVVASFDDQHFGLFYQYNDEGKLLRKMKETVRGMKTIVETQYNIPSVNRN